jgi:hypothetical protein
VPHPCGQHHGATAGGLHGNGGTQRQFFHCSCQASTRTMFQSKKTLPPFPGGRSMDVISNHDFYKILFVVERGSFFP